jgi:hypothetical protein
MKVPRACPLVVNDEAMSGDIMGDLVPGHVESIKGTARWSGPIASGGGTDLQLRTDEGSIVLLSKP